MKFESEVVSRMNLLTEVSTLCNNFRRWNGFISKDLEFLCLQDTQRNFHAKFSRIVEPFLQKIPPTLFLHAPEVEIPPPPQETAIVTSYRTHQFVEAKDFGVEPTPLVLKIL